MIIIKMLELGKVINLFKFKLKLFILINSLDKFILNKNLL